jgi:glycosyltransferase involved in cell wall biosynthesis
MSNSSKTTIFMAPHLEYPPRNGGDIYIERLGRYLSNYREVVILSKNKQITYNCEAIVREISFPNVLPPKALAAMRTIYRQSHYLLERFITNNYSRQAQELIEQNREATILCSYLITIKIFEGIPYNLEKRAVITQNDEIVWFQNHRKLSNNPFQKIVAWLSEQWVDKFLVQNANKYLFIHINALDFAGYEKRIPAHQAIIVPAGVDIQTLPPQKNWDGILRLLFVGSLNARPNYDALVFFGKQFWPSIKERFGNRVQVYVAGSQPSQLVRRLCTAQGWALYADISDEELHALFGQATFAILSFPYTTGAKIKLLNSLAGGLPVLATTIMNYLPDQDFPPNLYSNNPEEWVQHLNHHIETGISTQGREACRQFAIKYSWEKIAEKLDSDLIAMGF